MRYATCIGGMPRAAADPSALACGLPAAWPRSPLTLRISRLARTRGPAQVPRCAHPVPFHGSLYVERTLILLKPDAVQRGLVGKILARFEDKGLKLVGLKLRQFPKNLLEEHYAVHAARPFFAGLVRYMGSGPVVALALEGKDAIAVTRRLIGKTNCAEAEPGTIRGDLGMSFSNNLVHGSDGPESAAKELRLFFGGEGELLDWTPSLSAWIYNLDEEG